jgi:tetratricopeptide (TPR) repeat protein
LYFRREYDQAIPQLQKTLEIEPDYYLAHVFLYLTYVQKQMYDQAIAEKARILAEQSPQRAEAIFNRLRESYKAAGEQGLWREQIEILTKGPNPSFTSLIWITESYIRLDQKDRAFEWLKKAVDANHPGTHSLKVDPMFDPLRSDPRFQDLLSRVGLPQ